MPKARPRLSVARLLMALPGSVGGFGGFLRGLLFFFWGGCRVLTEVCMVLIRVDRTQAIRVAGGGRSRRFLNEPLEDAHH